MPLEKPKQIKLSDLDDIPTFVPSVIHTEEDKEKA